MEVKAGKPLKVTPEPDYVFHLSQVSLDSSKNQAESVSLKVKCGDQKAVVALLSHEKIPHASLDLIFGKEFELSHDWKNGSVYFSGYKSPMEDGCGHDHAGFPEESDSEEEEILAVAENGKPKVNAAKPNAKAEGLVKVEESDDDDDYSEDDDSLDFSDSDDEMLSSDEEEEEEETPVKVEVSKDAGKKRQAESATKTPQAKKAKSATPEKTDGKKGGKTATPQPAKQAGKSAAKTPKSGGQIKCGSCSKTFTSDQALQSHSKAKHSAK